MKAECEIAKIIRQTLRGQSKYKSGRYKLLEEVKRATGYVKPERFADAIEISFYKSNKEGPGLTGYEIKCSRSDLLNDLRDSEKTNCFKQFCDFWILIVSDESVINGRIEIPDDWGIWIHCPLENENDGYFHIKRQPKRLYPKPVDRYFLAELLQKA